MSKVQKRKTAEDYELEGWSICPQTHLLIYKPPFRSDLSYEETFYKVTENKKLKIIYLALGLKMWGRVGTDDLFDSNYVRKLKLALEMDFQAKIKKDRPA